MLIVYLFTLAFGMSLGPLSWTVCAEVGLALLDMMNSTKRLRSADFPDPPERKMLCHYNVCTVGFHGGCSSFDTNYDRNHRLVDIVSLTCTFQRQPENLSCANLPRFSIFFGLCCLTCLVWIIFFVPETNGVALGRPMDELFGLQIDEEEEDEEDNLADSLGPTEITALLSNEHARRKMSLS